MGSKFRILDRRVEIVSMWKTVYQVSVHFLLFLSISPKKSSQDNKEDDIASPSQKGRRHIRSILSDRDLTRETLEAKKQEMQRIERIKDRHKIIETLTQSFSSQHSEDVSNKSKKLIRNRENL